MKIYINDIERHFPNPALTLAELVRLENMETRGIAVAVNNKVVRKAVWDATLLSEGDRLTVIKIAFGG